MKTTILRNELERITGYEGAALLSLNNIKGFLGKKENLKKLEKSEKRLVKQYAKILKASKMKNQLDILNLLLDLTVEEFMNEIKACKKESKKQMKKHLTKISVSGLIGAVVFPFIPVLSIIPFGITVHNAYKAFVEYKTNEMIF